MKIEVGQKLWFVPETRKAGGYFVEVMKVGRKWIYLKKADGAYELGIGRVEIDSSFEPGIVKDGDYTRGYVYLTREGYAQLQKVKSMWTALNRDMPWEPPEGVTAEHIAQARELLKL